MEKTIDEKIITKANEDVTKLFSDNGFIFTEYLNRQAMANLNAPSYAFDEDWTTRELLILGMGQVFHPIKKIDISGIYEKINRNNPSISNDFMPTELRTSQILRKRVVGSVFGSKPSYDAKSVALYQINVYPKSLKEYSKIKELCNSASKIYSNAFGKDWSITVNKQ